VVLTLDERLQRLLGAAYRIEVEMHGGGMSRVFLAHEPALKRDVVVKVLPPDLVSSESVARFRREIEVTALLQHPYILPVITAGGDGDLFYYIAPFIRGESLRDRLASVHNLSLDEAGRLGIELLSAAAFAHARGVIHRDIKPGNVLLAEGHAILADFGIARALASADDDRPAASGTTVGTRSYMAPERPRDEAADLYAVAVLLCQMLTGELPPATRTPDVVTAAITEAKRDDADRSRATRVARVVAKALSDDPRARYATAREFRDALGKALAMSAPRSVRNAALALTVVAVVSVIGAQVAISHRATVARRATLGRIVVAPLQNFTGVDSIGVVGEMAGDWITEGLQKTGVVDVVPTTGAVEALRYAVPNGGAGSRSALAAPAVLAHETGAATVVYGAIYKVHDQLEFRVSVADQQGNRIAGMITNVSAPIGDPIGGVEELRTRVMGWLASHYDDRLTAFFGADAQPPTYDAYRAFTGALADYVDVDCVHATPLFQRAAHLDSSFTVARLYASICMTNLGEWARADSLLRIVDAHRRDLNAYHRAWLDYRIAFIRGEPDRELDAIRRAAKEAPESKAAYNLAVVAYQTGHLHEALAAVERLHPDRGPMRGFAPYWSLYGFILHALGDYDREYAIGEAAAQQYPGRLSPLTPAVRALAATGRIAELTLAMRNADTLRADPGQWDQGHLYAELAEELKAHGNGTEAIAYAQLACDWIRKNANSPIRLAHAYYALGRWQDAAGALAPLRKADPERDDLRGLAGLIAARTGDSVSARALADSLLARRQPYDRGVASEYRARIAGALGDNAAALRLVREALSEGGAYDLWLHRDPDLAAIRGDPAFAQLLAGRK
jgi:serine/threonine-protein kinase